MSFFFTFLFNLPIVTLRYSRLFSCKIEERAKTLREHYVVKERLSPVICGLGYSILMSPNLVNLPTEIIENIALYLLPDNRSPYLHEYKTSSIFNFRLASAQLAIKSHHAFAKAYFSTRIYHGFSADLERLALVAKDASLRRYIKCATIILRPTGATTPAAEAALAAALNSLPHLKQLDLLAGWTERPACSAHLPSALQLPRLTRLSLRNLAFDAADLARFLAAHPSLQALDLRDARALSGPLDAVLAAVLALPHLREAVLGRRAEGRSGGGRGDLYGAEDAGAFLAEEGLDVRLGSAACRIVAASRERMRDGVAFVRRRHRECVRAETALFLARLAQRFPGFGAAERRGGAAAVEAQWSVANCKRDVQVH